VLEKIFSKNKVGLTPNEENILDVISLTQKNEGEDDFKSFNEWFKGLLSLKNENRKSDKNTAIKLLQIL